MTTKTMPRLYSEVRPGADFQNTLNLLQRFKALHPNIPTKSSLMAGLGQSNEEILLGLRALRAHDVSMLTNRSTPAAVQQSPCVASLYAPRHVKIYKKKLTGWDSGTLSGVRWCVARTKLISRGTCGRGILMWVLRKKLNSVKEVYLVGASLASKFLFLYQ